MPISQIIVPFVCGWQCVAGGAAAQQVSGCGTVVRGVECNLFSFDNGGTYIVFIPGAQAGERYTVSGTIDPECVSFCMEGAGCIVNTQVAPCATGGPVFARCGTAVQGFPCLLFEADGGGLYVVDFPEGTQAGHRLHVEGVGPFACATVCNQGDGCVTDAVFSECGGEPIEACGTVIPGGTCPNYFESDSGAVYMAPLPVDAQVGDRLRVTGRVMFCRNVCSGSDGCIISAAFDACFDPPPCPADFNRSGAPGVQDVYDFLTAWQNGHPRGDFNRDSGSSVQDVYDFLTTWAGGCE